MIFFFLKPNHTICNNCVFPMPGWDYICKVFLKKQNIQWVLFELISRLSSPILQC